MKRPVRVVLLAVAVTLTACAHTPPVRMQYYHSRADLGLKVTRTVACDAQNYPIVANVVTPTIRYSADRGAGPESISVAGLRGPLTDTDLKFEFQEDGRLKGVNATTTGQGEVILKSAFSFFGAVLAVDGGDVPVPALCAQIKTWNEGKPITLTFEGTLDLGRRVEDRLELEPDAASQRYALILQEAVGRVCARVSSVQAGTVPVLYTPQGDDVLLPLRQPGLGTVLVTAGRGESCGSQIWAGTVAAGQIGVEYSLPIPRAAAFGKQTFVVAVNESGSLGSVQYAHTSGVGQAFNAATAGLDLVDGQTAAQKAAELKAEADLIAAQQRLVACRANWAGCK